jgi:hypothetical protein
MQQVEAAMTTRFGTSSTLLERMCILSIRALRGRDSGDLAG